MGCRSGTKVSRYEHCRRVPALPTVFAYEAIFRVPPRELFAGVFEEAKRITVQRVRILHRRLGTDTPDKLTVQKLALLQSILGPANDP